MFGPIIAVFAGLRRLARRREGNIAILFGLSAIPLIVGAGIAVDAARGYAVKTELDAALDSAALAVGSSSSQLPALTTAQLTTRLQNYFNANYPNSGIPTNNISVSMTDPTQTTFTVTASAQVPTSFLQLVGINNIPISATNQITKGTNALELALVLDNTGSMMCGDGSPANINPCTTPAHMIALKSNAQSIVDTLFADSVDPTKLKIAVVPYVTAVNVGNALCTGPKACPAIATDCVGNFLTDGGNSPVGTFGNNPIYNPSTAIAPPTTTVTVTGNTTRNSTSITNISPNTSNLITGMSITGTGIPGGATVSAVNSATQITISSNATANGTAKSLTLSITGVFGHWTNGSNTLSIYPAAASTVASGVIVTTTTANQGIGTYNGGLYPASASVDTFSAGTVTLCPGVLTTAAAGTATTPVPLTLYPAIAYDTTNTVTTGNWKGCVVEPTASGEDTSGVGPDITEPSGGWTAATMGGDTWWAYYWQNGPGSSYTGNGNTWYVAPNQSIQYTYNGSGNYLAAYDGSYGPNLACPTPLVRLTNSQSTLDTTMQNMTAWADGGTAITVGMVWGWRAISPNPPFSDGQPYGTPSLVKAVVLETDGNAEVAGAPDFTSYGYISEDKLGSTTPGSYPGNPSNTSLATFANLNLQNRLTTLCTNMKNAGIVIYTIGLGSGATNAQLSSCAGPPGQGQFFAAPTAADLTTAFQNIAISLNALRLSK